MNQWSLLSLTKNILKLLRSIFSKIFGWLEFSLTESEGFFCWHSHPFADFQQMKRDHFKRKIVFQPAFLGECVGFFPKCSQFENFAYLTSLNLHFWGDDACFVGTQKSILKALTTLCSWGEFPWWSGLNFGFLKQNGCKKHVVCFFNIGIVYQHIFGKLNSIKNQTGPYQWTPR